VQLETGDSSQVAGVVREDGKIMVQRRGTQKDIEIRNTALAPSFRPRPFFSGPIESGDQTIGVEISP